MKHTPKQIERQSFRDSDGKYSHVHHCEKCGKPVGVDYYSAPNCNETGIGIVLCKRCAAKAEGE